MGDDGGDSQLVTLDFICCLTKPIHAPPPIRGTEDVLILSFELYSTSHQVRSQLSRISTTVYLALSYRWKCHPGTVQPPQPSIDFE